MTTHIRVGAAAPKIQVANCSHNAKQIIALMHRAAKENIHLLCMPELSITGSTCGSLLGQRTLHRSAKKALLDIQEATKDVPVIATVGLPLECLPGQLYTVVAVIYMGEVLAFVHRGASEGDKGQALQWGEGTVPFGPGITFQCKQNPAFAFMVASGGGEIPQAHNALITLNPTCYAETLGIQETRRDAAKAYSQNAHVFVMANTGMGESTTDQVYSGHGIIAQGGTILAEALPFGSQFTFADIVLPTGVKHFAAPRPLPFAQRNAGIKKGRHINPSKGQIITFDMDVADYTPLPHTLPFGEDFYEETLAPKDDPYPFFHVFKKPEQAFAIQTAGLAGRLEYIGGRAVIGVSGGLDSTLALLVTANAYAALDKPLSDIVAVTMPCFGTTQHTKNNALALCAALGIPCREIDISNSVTQHLRDIGHPEGALDVVFENAQARMRTMVLMNLANQEGGIVVGTGSMSELALGWATFNGDHMSMYAVSVGVPKTLVRHIVEHLAEESENEALKGVLASILATKVSPELLPTPQHTEDILGPYEVHDYFLYYMLQNLGTPFDVYHHGLSAFGDKYSKEQMRQWLHTFYTRYFSQQFKRNCFPDGPQVLPFPFCLSPRIGLSISSTASSGAWLEDIERITHGEV